MDIYNRSLGKKKNTSFFVAIAVLLILLLLVIYPLYSLLLRAFISGGKLSLNNFYRALNTKDIFVALNHSIFVSTVSTFFATVIGVILIFSVPRVLPVGSPP